MKSIFRSNTLNRRHRQVQPEQHGEEQAFFFQGGQHTQNNKSQPFFQAKLTVGKPGDPYEREADAVADAVVNHSAGQQPVVQRKPITPLGASGSLQRLATPDEEKMPSTNDARMEEDKAIQEKPIQKMDAPEPKEEEMPVQKAAAPEEEEPLQMMSAPEEEEEAVQTQAQEEDEPLQMMSAPEEEEEPVQMQAQEEEEPLQMMSAPEEEEEPLQMQAQEEEEPLQMMSAPEEEEEPLQAKSQPGARPAAANLGNRLSQRQGSGKPMPKSVRSEMEHSFGVNFRGVHIHTDSEAVQMNQDLNAQAFTHGQDVYFNSGKFNPENTEGKRLLAHELTHVVQQGGQLRKKSIIQRDIKGADNVKHGKFEIDMAKQEIPPETKAGEKGTVKFTPNEKSPDTNDIGLVQIVKLLDKSTASPADYSWTGGEADRNSVKTSGTTAKYQTKEKETLKTISESQTKGHITSKELYEVNSGALGWAVFDENKEITKGTELTIPQVQEGYFIDHSAASAKATPRASKTDPEVPLYYRDYWPNTANSQDGFKKSKTNIQHASLWDFPGWSKDSEFSFETVARSKDKGFDFGTIHWGFTIDSGKITNAHYHVEEGTSPTFKSAISEFNDFYKNHHIVVEGETLYKLAELYYGDGTKWTEIQKANKLKDTTIVAGQQLIIPNITKV